MIIVERITIREKDFQHTYSDEGFFIENNGIQYADAIDPIDSNRIYTETDVLIPVEEAE